MIEEKRLRNEKTARYFCNSGIKAHLTRQDNFFFNGIIKEVGYDFLIIDDDKNGHMVIFFNELKNDIEEYKKEEVGDGSGS